jgi:hypothetical protein
MHNLHYSLIDLHTSAGYFFSHDKQLSFSASVVRMPTLLIIRIVRSLEGPTKGKPVFTNLLYR